MGQANLNIRKLHVEGIKLMNDAGEIVQLRGISTHGIERYPEYINEDSFRTFRDDWKVNVIRLAMYTEEPGGYCLDGNKQEQKEIMKKGVEIATKLGLYVIIDWHILFDYDPRKHEDEAAAFFEEMSAEFAGYTNVIYEICNEPQQSPWAKVIRPYAEKMISVIRKNDKDALILVGTNTWSQEVDDVIGQKLSDSNVMYVAHFYATTHKDALRSRVLKALADGVPVFISECSICDASGNGEIDYESANAWIDLADANDLSYIVWNLSNKDESSAFILPDCKKLSDWTTDELSDTAKWFREKMRSYSVND